METNAIIAQNEDETLLAKVYAVMEYINSQRIFIIGNPSMSFFNELICGYGSSTYQEIWEGKMRISKNNQEQP